MVGGENGRARDFVLGLAKLRLAGSQTTSQAVHALILLGTRDAHMALAA